MAIKYFGVTETLMWVGYSLAAQTLPYSHWGGRGGSGEMTYPILFREYCDGSRRNEGCHVT